MNKITFPENEIRFDQDFRAYKGIPAGIEFEWEYLDERKRDRIRLTAPGYGVLRVLGPDLYGNGSLYVNVSDIPSSIRKEAGLPEEEPPIFMSEFNDIVNNIQPMEIDNFLADLRRWFMAVKEGKTLNDRGFLWFRDGAVGYRDEVQQEIQQPRSDSSDVSD